MEHTFGEVKEAFEKKSERMLGKCLSAVENRESWILKTLQAFYPHLHRTPRIGITGPPGSGKSTLVGCFLDHLTSQGKSVAVFAVDPFSPLSGGAILGDRIRLAEFYNHKGVFIRSLSSRGKLGGMTRDAHQSLHLLDAFGFDYILIETVGVGQNEVDVSSLCDLTLLLLTPESGDGIQSIKSGVMEMGDFFVLNKSDRPQSDKIWQELRTLWSIKERVVPFERCHFQTEAHTKKGVAELWAEIDLFFKNMSNQKYQQKKEAESRALLESFIEKLIRERLEDKLQSLPATGLNPYEMMGELASELKLKSPSL